MATIGTFTAPDYRVSAEGAVIAYDGRGNMKTDGVSTWAYDLENRLRGEAGGASLAYDPLGRLYQAASPGIALTWFLYDGTTIIGEYSASTATVPMRRYVHGEGLDEPLVQYNDGATTGEWLLADQQGSIIGSTSTTGSIATQTVGSTAVRKVLTYNEYGVPGAGNVGLFQYTGQVYLKNLDLYHYKARDYSPFLGRFMQSDPTGYDDGLNW